MEYKTNKSDIGESNGRFVMTLLSFNLNLRSVLSSDLEDIIERCPLTPLNIAKSLLSSD